MLLTKQQTQIAESLFTFDQEAHARALSMPLGMFIRERLKTNEVKERFSLYAKGVDVPIIHHLAGWYWLDHCLSSGAIEHNSRRREKVLALYEERTLAIAEFMSEYVMTICSGEMRHGQTRASWHKFRNKKIIACEICEPFFNAWAKPSDVKLIDSRSAGAEIFHDKAEPNTYGTLWNFLVHGFTEHSWGSGSGMGGPKWGYIAWMGRNMWTAWAEGDLSGVAKWMDFVIHAVHNGANCLHDKFNWYTTGSMSELIYILNAKFIGKPCCWASIQNMIPDVYKVVKPPERCKELTPKPSFSYYWMEAELAPKNERFKTCKHITATIRDMDSTPKEELLYATFFADGLDKCEKCKQPLNLSGYCAGMCISCKECFEGYHRHFCFCGKAKPKAEWGVFKCVNYCEICYKLTKKYYKNLGYNLPIPDLPEMWELHYAMTGCHQARTNLDPRILSRLACHDCDGSYYDNDSLKSHTKCERHIIIVGRDTICGKTGQCYLCEEEKALGLKYDLPAPKEVQADEAVKKFPDAGDDIPSYWDFDQKVDLETAAGISIFQKGISEGLFESIYRIYENPKTHPESQSPQSADEEMNALAPWIKLHGCSCAAHLKLAKNRLIVLKTDVEAAAEFAITLAERWAVQNSDDDSDDEDLDDDS